LIRPFAFAVCVLLGSASRAAVLFMLEFAMSISPFLHKHPAQVVVGLILPPAP
jgi:hypothetical protein